MNSTIIDKVHSSFYTVLNAYYDAYENYYGGDTPKDNRSELRLVVDGKGVSITEHGYLIDNLDALPSIDLNKDTLILKVDLDVSLFDAQEGDLYFHTTGGFREVARGVGLDDLLLNLSRITPIQLGETLCLPSDLEE
jgi:hypothetical protein